MILSACGNDCEQCPRKLPKTDAELRATAVLWRNIGYRDTVVTVDEIACSGCDVGNWCRYNIVECVKRNGIENCGMCGQYPCERIEECFRATAAFEPACRANCSDIEYSKLRKAFFCKRENLDGIAK